MKSKLTLSSLKRLINETIEEERRGRSRSKKARFNSSQRREKKLVENALRLLEAANPASNLDDHAKEDLAKAKAQLDTFDVKAGLEDVVEWLNKHLNAASNPEGEKVARALHAVLGQGTLDGANNQKFALSPKAGIDCASLKPTQGEIDLFKSVGHPLCNPPSFMACWSGDPHGAGKSIVTAGKKLVLDGHHRWSTVACIAGPGTNIDCSDFSIDSFGEDAQAVLSAAQVAIVGSAQYDQLASGPQMVPKSEVSTLEIDGQEFETDILGDPNALKGQILTLKESGNDDIGVFDSYAKTYANHVLLSDSYMQYALYGQVLAKGGADAQRALQSQPNVESFQDQLAPQDGTVTQEGKFVVATLLIEAIDRPDQAAYDMTTKQGQEKFEKDMDDYLAQFPDSKDVKGVDTANGFPEKFCQEFGLKAKPISSHPQGWLSYTPEERTAVYSQILDKLVANWSAVKGGLNAADQPKRSIMPQFDGGKSHKSSVGKGFDKKVFKNMQDGHANYKDPYVTQDRLAASHYRDGDTLSESVDLKRWHKLAGIIKD